MLLNPVPPYTGHMTLSPSSSGLLASLSDELAAAVERAGRSVLAVHGRRRFPASGLAWRGDQVLTAAHVLERDTDLRVTAPNGTDYPARLIGRDSAIDVAVLAVDSAPLTPLDRGRADLGAGHLVLAVGRPGTPTPIASFGVVSSVGGAWRTAQGAVLEAYLRADISLLPGLSGGALADVHGRVVGLLSSHLAGGEPVAIPVGTLDRIVQRLLSGGSPRRAYLGVSTQPVPLQDALRQRLGVTQQVGLMLLGLEPNAPADRAGLLLGDIVLAIGGRAIEDGEALQMALGPEAVGAPTAIRLIRGGQLVESVVTPAERPG